MDMFTDFKLQRATSIDILMKKIIFLTLAFAIATSCGSKDKGELVGVKGKRWHPEKPYGMSLIPGGAFVMGKSDDDIVDLEKLKLIL